MRTHHRTATAFALALVLAVPAYASARDGGIALMTEDVGADSRMEEMIVTGTKRNRTLQDTQTSVELLTEAVIEERALVNVLDIFLRTPNVSTAGTSSEFSIRGININGVGDAGSGTTANIYIDGAPASFDSRHGELFDQRAASDRGRASRTLLRSGLID